MKSRALLYTMVAALAGLIVLELWMRNADTNKDTANDDLSYTAVDYASTDDIELQAAFDQARSSLNYFFKTANNPPQNTQGFSVKVVLRDGSDTEYFWLYPFSEEVEGYSGKVIAEAKIISGVLKGDTVKFTRGQIVDWTFEDKTTDKMHGNFTACVELARVAPENFEQFQKLYGLNCTKP